MDAAICLGDEEKSLLGQTKRFLASLRNDKNCHYFLREGLGLQVDFEMTEVSFLATLWNLPIGFCGLIHIESE